MISFQKLLAVVCLLALPALGYGECLPSVVGGQAQFALLAGQSINAGTVTVTVDGAALKVRYQTSAGWELSETDMWVGTSLSDLPETKQGNPSPGQFPYKASSLSGATAYEFSVPLQSPAINFDCPTSNAVYYLAAHASLKKRNVDGSYQQETGWSDGSRITTRGNWATFSTFTLTCLCSSGSTTATSTECETAFAYDPQAHTDFLTAGFERWGWTNGPYAPGRYVVDLYAAAGQSDITKGYLAGTVIIDYSGSVATVTYETRLDWTLNETHLYVGSTAFPTVKQGAKRVSTVSPGQFPYQHSLDAVQRDTFAVAVTGPIYIIAHAVACRASN